MYIEQESFTEAQEAIDAGLKLDSDNFSLHVVNVELAKKVGRYGRAVESMDFIMSSGPVTNFMYLPSVEFYFKAGCYDQAMDLADLGLQGPQKVECTRVKSSILEAQGKYKEAAECLEGYLSEGLSIRRSLFTEPRAAVMGAKLAYLWCLAGNKGRARIWSTKFSEILGRHYLEETESVVRESASAVVVASKPEPVVGRTTAAVMAADEKLYQARLRHLQSLEVYIKSLLTSRLYSKRSLRKLADNLADYTMKHGVEHADEFLDTCHIPKYLRGELSDYLTEREVISTTDFYTPGDGVGPMESGISVVTGLGGLGAFISTTESLTLFSALTTTVVSSGVGMYVAHLFRKHYGDRVVRRRKNKQLRKKTVNNMLRIHTRKYREVKLQLE
jgi:tetratricopeptide (TPR) repeat protein